VASLDPTAANFESSDHMLLYIIEFFHSSLTSVETKWQESLLSVTGSKCSVKALPRTGHEGPKGLSLTLVLDGGVGGQCHALAALLPGRTRYPMYRMLGGPQGQSGWVQKILAPTGF
jgi:hypothetical protein